MAITFEIHEIPKSEYHPESVSEEESRRIAENVKKVNANLEKAMKKIARKEAENLANAHNMIRG